MNIYFWIAASLAVLDVIFFTWASILKKSLSGKLDSETRKKKAKLRKTAGLLSLLLTAGALIALLPGLNSAEKAAYDLSALNHGVKLAGLVKETASEGNTHIALTDPDPQYKAYPPVSGNHIPQVSPWGFYDKARPLKILVHNLEHGDIVIYYKKGADQATVSRLKTLTGFTKVGSGVIAVPDEKIQAAVVATAWTKSLPLDSFGKNEQNLLDQFIYDNIYQGPEKLPAGYMNQ